MPLYEYKCDACGHRFEVIRKYSDSPIEKCPVCGGAVHKLQSAPAFHFKGTGWYVTDYAKKDGAETAKTDGGSTDAGKDQTDKAAKTDKADKTDKSDKTDRATSAGDTAKTSNTSAAPAKDS